LGELDGGELMAMRTQTISRYADIKDDDFEELNKLHEVYNVDGWELLDMTPYKVVDGKTVSVIVTYSGVVDPEDFDPEVAMEALKEEVRDSQRLEDALR
jgi:hypothetical protein